MLSHSRQEGVPAGVGPMGLGTLDYALHRDRKPALLVVTNIDEARLKRAESIYSVEHAILGGVELHSVNTGKLKSAAHRDCGFCRKRKTDPLFAKLDEIVRANNGLWCTKGNSICWQTPAGKYNPSVTTFG